MMVLRLAILTSWLVKPTSVYFLLDFRFHSTVSAEKCARCCNCMQMSLKTFIKHDRCPNSGETWECRHMSWLSQV